MKYYSRCFSAKELVSYIKASPDTQRGISKYDKEKDYYIEDSLEVDEFIEDFFSLFKVTPNGEPLAAVLKSDSQINIFNKGLKNIEVFWTELLRELDIGLALDSLVSYRKEVDDYVLEWERIKKEVLAERRFFCRCDEAWSSFFEPNSSLSSSSYYYRARVHVDGRISKYPPKDMFAPPAKDAPNGRTNPEGIAYLYLCGSKETTLYETRAILNDYVSIATFKVKPGSTVNIFDFTIQSAFLLDEKCLNIARKIRLFDAISKDLSKPMRRHSKKLEYLPTQFICEFINFFSSSEGIVFRSSVHEDGTNIVLFNSEKMQCKKVELVAISSLNVKWELKK